ncbi:MAG TPA: FAD-binding oxidoreductase, partial [Thermomicrobiales bacterium]|nr:FAD-binding oxidoreductase [Thermomicrobiales bacterium]
MTIDRSPSAQPTLFEATLRAFRADFTGETLRAGDAEYDAARRVWNGMIDRRPALIARCANPGDVVRALALARAEALPVAVRGGGHSAAGLAVADGGLVIDLSPMRAVDVDPVARTARAEGGATWADFDRATHAHGLATTGGAISTTGIAGLTLGGGLGWLMRSYGLACDNLLAAEVVTADGRQLVASADENADLFWGLRGGGGNFGVVTAFTYRLHPVGPVLGGMLVHPAARAEAVLRHYRDVTREAPDGLTTFAALMASPDGMPIVALLPSWNGPLAEGEAAMQPLRDFGPPVADQVGPLSYPQLQSMLDEGFPSGLQVYWRSDFLPGLSDEAIATIVAHFGRITSPLSAILIEQLGGAVGRVGVDETAFTHRDADYNLAIIARWNDPAEAERHFAWVRELAAAVRPFARGVYVNYLGVGDDASRVRAA